MKREKQETRWKPDNDIEIENAHMEGLKRFPPAEQMSNFEYNDFSQLQNISDNLARNKTYDSFQLHITLSAMLPIKTYFYIVFNL